MIYLFNESKSLSSIIRREEISSILYERETNNLYQVSAELPIMIEDKDGEVSNLYDEVIQATYIGHYDLNEKFQLHKIVSVDAEDTTFLVTAIHLFFDEAKAGAITDERRFIDRPVQDSASYALGLIGWTLEDFDVSDAKTVSFFNDSVLEAQSKIIEKFGFKFDYWIDFDGQKITGKYFVIKEELGGQTHQRFTYGHNALGISLETDFSEIYTAVIGRGHGERIERLDDEGEELEDSFGRRIEFTDVAWSKSNGDPLDKPVGERVLIDPESTQTFGYVNEDGTVSPRYRVVEFSDIEDKEELLQASYEWLMDNNEPKAVYTIQVPETDELDLGDEVYVIYRDIDFIKTARVSKVVDNLITKSRAVEFGDTEYFRRNSETARMQREIDDTRRSSADYIQDLKREANARIDAEMQQARDDFEQALIEAHAEIEAAESRMSDLISGTRSELETEFEAEVEAAKEYADTQIAAKEQQYVEDWDLRDAQIQSTIEQIVGGSVDSLDSSLLEVISDLEGKVNNQEFTNLINDYEATILRVDEAETAIGTFQATADGLSAQFANYQEDFGEDVQALTAQVAAYEFSVEGFRSEVGELQTDIDSIDGWIETKGSVIDQTADAITARVWKNDIANPNIIPFHDMSDTEHRRQWLPTPPGTYLSEGGNGFVRVRNGSMSGSYIAVYTPFMEVVEGVTYTIQFESAESPSNYNTSGLMDYTWLMYPNVSNVSIQSSILNSRMPVGNYAGMTIYKYTHTFVANETTDRFRVLVGTRVNATGVDTSFYMRRPKLEISDRATPYYSPYSALESRTDFILRSDGFILGGNYVGGEHYSTAIIGDADGLKLLGDTIIDGNLYVKERIESYALSAVEADIGRLFANTADINFIKSTHIESSNATIDKLFSSNARIDRLVTKTHFSDQIHAMSLSAVYADIANLRTNLLTVNVINSTHISSDNALIDKLFATSALIERLTSKTAFISYLRTHIIDTNHIRVGFNDISSDVTISPNGIVIDGGALTVNRDDGGAPTMIRGHNPSGIALFPATPHRRDSGFTIDGQYARRDAGSNFMIYDFYMFEWFYSDLMLDFAIYNYENHDIRVRVEILGTDGSTFSRAVDYTVPHSPIRVAFPRIILNLGVPDGSLQRFFVRVRNVGTSSQHGRFGIHTYMVKHLDNGHGYPRLEI